MDKDKISKDFIRPRLKWYLDRFKDAQTEIEKKTTTAALIGFLEGLFDL